MDAAVAFELVFVGPGRLWNPGLLYPGGVGIVAAGGIASIEPGRETDLGVALLNGYFGYVGCREETEAWPAFLVKADAPPMLKLRAEETRWIWLPRTLHGFACRSSLGVAQWSNRMQIERGG